VATTRTNVWTTGFDFAEVASDPSSLTVSNLYVINCSVNGAWESGFHMEGGNLVKQNVVITGCDSRNAGQKPDALYGAGYLINGDTVIYNNTASSNRVDLLLWAAPITPMGDGISPPTSTKTATAINQGNCSGVMVTLDATHKELVLYSNDGNPVSQQLELGGYYASADGNTYSFGGTRILAQFTDYATMNLVAGSAPAATTNAPSGLTASGATLNANLASKGTASTVTVSFEYGLTSSYGSVAPGSPPALATTGAFAAGLTGLTPSTLYHYRADAVGDGTSYGADQTFTTLTPPLPLTVVTQALPNGTVGAAYSQTLAATGGMTPYTWTIASGTLPAGLSISSNGVISGTPTTASGPTQVTFQVADSASATATKSLSIAINGTPATQGRSVKKHS
jgi:hypothetical protein